MNRLAAETSPYLRQHQDNPVDWYPWGPEAMERARAEDKPLLLSIGYSSCHWCHVMAHESFEDDEVAAVMNDRFVNVKVDREERPDVDAVYMDAVQAMNGAGGWPMTVFCAPDGRPFYGGTYYPRPTFLQLLAAVDEAWASRRPELLSHATQLTEALDRTGRLEPADALPGVDDLNRGLGALAQSFDAEWGGFGGAPKFPQAMNLDLVLRAYAATGSPDVLTVVTTTLDAMASGGIYDHVGGGFARYSTDREWLVPHFEKMLYDQALLVPVYLHAWQLTGEARYRQVVEETVGYVLRDLGQAAGGFSSAEDADSPGPDGHNEEGRFSTWTPAEMETAGAGAAIDWYGVTEAGNFEGRSILWRPVRGDLLRPAAVEAARQRLFEVREQRPRPLLDDKVLTEWNALMVAALAEAGAATGTAAWVDAAEAAMQFLVRELRDERGRWLRSWQADGGGRARHAGLAADHAALVHGFVALAQASGRAGWTTHAVATADALLDHFWDPVHGGLFTTADDAEVLVARQKDLLDGATPSANSLAALAFYRLAALTDERRYAHHADQILQLVASPVANAPSAFGHLLAAVDTVRAGITEVVVAGNRPDLLAAVLGRYLPNSVVAWGERFDSPLWEGREDGRAYVCRNYACQVPAETVEVLAAQLVS